MESGILMTLAAAIELEQHLEPDGDTIGWLARYGEDRALWCGEMTCADFMANRPRRARPFATISAGTS